MAVLIVQAFFGTRVEAEPPNGTEASLREQNLRLSELNRRLDEQNRRLDEQNQGLARQLEEMSRRYEELSRRLDRVSSTVPAPKPTAVEPPRSDRDVEAASGADEYLPQPTDIASDDDLQHAAPFLIGGYDLEKNQFILVQPRDQDRTPFALNFDLITQLRFTGFARSAQTWTDSTGVVRPVRNFDEFEVNRNWFQFSGYALDPRLQFMAVVFSSSTSNSTLFLGWIDYQFRKGFVLSAGYFKVPGSREWSDSFRYTLGADRTLATTFFRPSMSPGVWASGEPLSNLHYVAMLANSFNGLDLAGNRIGSGMAFGGTTWWEPLGKFGPGPSDLEWHERPTPRLGSSLTVSRELLPGAAAVQSNPESTLFRLSDGTPLSQVGALAPGVRVVSTQAQLWSIDAALKYRGLSLSAEYYFRWLDNFRSIGGPLSIRSLFDHGALAQVSYFAIPRRLEGYARYSFVSGRFGGGDEWSGGLNWYVLGTRNWRMTFDVTRISHSPAENGLTGYRAGASGTLFQLQMLTDF